MTPQLSAELVELLYRNPNIWREVSRMRRCERREINRFAYRRDRHAWGWLALLLKVQFSASRMAQPDLSVQGFLFGRSEIDWTV